MEASRVSTDSEKEDEALLESQPITQQATAAPPEYSVPFRIKLSYLALYFMLNLSLTLTNKAVLQQVLLSPRMPYLLLLTHPQIKTPWLLTVVHATATSIGCSVLLATGHLKVSKLSTTEHLALLAFSTLFTLNIAVSNVSL